MKFINGNLLFLYKINMCGASQLYVISSLALFGPSIPKMTYFYNK